MGQYFSDEEGDVLANDDAARAMAINTMSEIQPSQRDQLNDGRRYSVVVAREDRADIYEIMASARRLEK